MTSHEPHALSFKLPPMRQRVPIYLRTYRWGLRNQSRVRGTKRLLDLLAPYVESHPCLFPWEVFDEYSIWVLSVDRNIEYCCFLNHGYGSHVAEIVRTVRGPGQVIYDAGANIGLYSLLAAAPRHAGSRVYSFEPVPLTRHRMQLNIALNHLEEFVTVVPTGLSDQVGEATIQFDRDDSGRATMYEGLIDGAEETIPLVPLDQAAAGFEPPHFIKVDVEGHDLAVVKGGMGLITQHRPSMLVECCSYNCEAAGWDFEEILGRLRPLGYEFWRVGENRFREEPDRNIRFPDVLCISPAGGEKARALRQLMDSDRLHAEKYE